VGPRWLSATSALLAVCVLAGCRAVSPEGEERCGEPLQVEPGEVRTVLRADWFDEDAFVVAGAALPDGSVLVGYDTNPDEAGDADDLAGEKEEPGLVVLRPDGSCAPFDLPEVDGRPVGADARPVAVDGGGPLHLWDFAELRPVRRAPDGAWESLVVIPQERRRYRGVPSVAVTDSGEVYVGTDFLVSRLTAADRLEPVAGTPPGSGTFSARESPRQAAASGAIG
jgi:hypothetical protein